MQVGEVFEARAVDFALPECVAVFRREGKIVFVPQVAPGEHCRVLIKGRKRSFFLGEPLQILEHSLFRVPPPCPHFMQGCGGCSLQYLEYGEQVRIKEKHAQQVLSRLGGEDCKKVHIEHMAPSPRSYEYRNKMEFNFGDKEGSLVLGLRPKNRWWDLVDISSCFLMKQELVSKLLNFFRRWGREASLSGYDPKRKEGLLRNLLIRYSESENAVMIGVGSTQQSLPDEEGMLHSLRRIEPRLTGLVIIQNRSPAGALLFEKTRTIWGNDYFFENVGNIRYTVSLSSFFQVNTAANQLVYEKAMELASPLPHEQLLDLYSGSGGIGLYMASSVKQVVGVEENLDGLKDARANAISNGIDNYTAIEEKVEKYLAHPPSKKFSLVTVDPPRAGLNTKVIRRLARLHPEKVVYISCNVGSLARDLQDFRAHGYRMSHISFVDLFPQTPHFEAVALLTPSDTLKG